MTQKKKLRKSNGSENGYNVCRNSAPEFVMQASNLLYSRTLKTQHPKLHVFVAIVVKIDQPATDY